MSQPPESTALPAPFRDDVASLRQALATPERPDVALSEVRAPQRTAPYAVAFTADVRRRQTVVATGRFVVLHDPAGQRGWQGHTRVVALVQADTDQEMAGDAALTAVGWGWLTEALADRGAQHTAAAGTVTRTISSRFGQLDALDDSGVEIRASWTPLQVDGGHQLAAHLGAWSDVLCAAAGLPPRGVAALR